MKTLIAATKGLSQHYIRTMCNSIINAAMPALRTASDSHIPHKGLMQLHPLDSAGGGISELLGTLLPKQKDTVITESTN